jgi:FkbM family methyltransferase
MRDSLSSWLRTARILSRNVVGASDGRHTVVMSRLVGEAGHVHCFEPSTFTLEILERAIRFHRIRNVSTFNVAIADQKGSTFLVTPVKANGHLGRSFAFVSDQVPAVEELREARGFRELHSTPVPVWTLDGYCEERGIEPVSLIRCDVEGAEGLVLAGARGILERDRPNLLLEIHPHALKAQFATSAAAIYEMLESLGYRFFYVKDDVLTPTNEFFDEPWRDYFCVPAVRAAELGLAA